MTNNDFLTTLEAKLSHLPATERNEILSDIKAFFADGMAPDDFGDPAEFARQFTASDDGDAPSERDGKWYIPSFDLLTDPGATDRWWDPTNPNIFVRKSLGIGWDVNLAALAVKAGIIRQDDLDDDVLAAVPEPLTRAIHLAPTTLALASAPIIVGLAAQGKVGSAVGHGLGLGLVTYFTRGRSSSRLISKSLATGLGVAIGVSAVGELAETKSGGLELAKVVALSSAPALAIAVIKSGIANVPTRKV